MSETLVVPIDVKAVCVGQVDATEGTPHFAGATVVWENAGRGPGAQAFLGANVWRSPNAAPWQRLEQGVHLHWALPDAMTHAAVTKTKLDFPNAPNRWVVTRFVVTGRPGAVPESRSWVVDSDALYAKPPTGQKLVTVPVKPADEEDVPYRYIGGKRDYTPELSAVPPGTARLANLSAVSNGVLSFAAYYPESKGVFGMHDDCADVDVSSGPVELMYTISGWFDDPALDGTLLAATGRVLNRKVAWSFDDRGVAPDSAVYDGTVSGIMWDPKTQYVPEGGQAPPIDASIALGNTPSEALAAYFRKLEDPANPLFEELLQAFQAGRADLLKQPTPDQLAELRQTLHDAEFGLGNAGIVYSLVIRDESGKESQATEIPVRLADALIVLNLAQQRLDRYRAQMLSYRRLLFGDWYRIFQAGDDATRNIAYLQAQHRFAGWDALVADEQKLDLAARAALDAVNAQVVAPMVLKTNPDERYARPAEPVVLLAANALPYPLRYGGDTRFEADGTLRCRMGRDVIAAVSAGGTFVDAARYAPVDLPPSPVLPDPSLINALRREACLLNARVHGASANDKVTVLAGTAPSPLAVNGWHGNPWLPIFLEWVVEFRPFEPTRDEQGGLQDYTPDAVDGNFVIEPTAPGFLRYDPPNGPVDPNKLQRVRYQGRTLLSTAATKRFRKQLADYLDSHEDPTLKKILGVIEANPDEILVQALTGFDDLLLMRRQGVQLTMLVPDGSPYQDITEAIAPIVGTANDVGPDFNGSFNPLRGGYLSLLSLVVVDAYGQKRPIQIEGTALAASLTPEPPQKAPGLAYLPPRLAQSSRLLFEWVAADGSSLDERAATTPVSPICGWLLPNRLVGGFFLYDGEGMALGSLRLDGNETKVVWQSAPGDDATIDQPVEVALAHENANVRDLAIALNAATPTFFKQFWDAVESVHSNVVPADVSSTSMLGVLIGRPVALVEASLRLEVDGYTATDQGWACVDVKNKTFIVTDDGTSAVRFPVVLGDLDRLDDGLIGFFTGPAGGAYDLQTFYTRGAPKSNTQGVVQPKQSTVEVTIAPADDGKPNGGRAGSRRVLMVLDPRAPVHAETGVLPTRALAVPADLTAGALAVLQTTFLAAPVLRGRTQLALPVPNEPGFDVSWVQETYGPHWVVTPQIGTVSGLAVWAYSPQRLVEGWLRLNPEVLTFELLDANNQPVVIAKSANALALTITNHKPAPITLVPGTTVPEGTKPSGSVFYVHFGALATPAAVAAAVLSAAGWRFTLLQDARYGTYWAATPLETIRLPAGGTIAVSLTNLVVAADAPPRAPVSFDYYAVGGIDDGVSNDVLSVTAPIST